jgi:tRNA (cmo5U34)-methyltransferase
LTATSRTTTQPKLSSSPAADALRPLLLGSPNNVGMPAGEWGSSDHVRHYLEHADEFPRRAEGERVLLDHVPPGAERVLDLGTGDGRLLALLGRERPHQRGLLGRERPHQRGVGLDVSDVMLDAARARFEGQEHIDLVEHDLVRPLPKLGRFDAVVSSMAIHHLEHERKRELYAEAVRGA